MQKKQVRALGLMSGTSMDGIDVALLVSDGVFEIKQEQGALYPYDEIFRRLLKASEYAVKYTQGHLRVAEEKFHELFHRYCLERLQMTSDELKDIVQCSTEYIQKHLAQMFDAPQKIDDATLSLQNIIKLSTGFHIQAVQNFCQTQKIEPQHIDVIGYHGQTLYHNPEKKMTLQVGDAAQLAAACGVAVVYNFREQDVVHGGHGAPFAPIYHHALTQQSGCPLPVVIVNSGGIANVTLIQDADPAHVIGFDTGPGNVLLDRFVLQKTQGAHTMDVDGHYGLQGTVQHDVLEQLYATSCWQQQQNYYEKQPPKSLDVNDFRWPLAALDALSLPDGCATLAALTTKTIVQAMTTIQVKQIYRWILAGGGWHNQATLKYMKQYAKDFFPDSDVVCANEIGWNGDLLEAQLFAYLAVRHLRGLPTSYPAVTGASKATVGGEYVAC